MADTVGDVWRAVSLHCPRVDPGLTRLWVQQGYQKLADWKNWSFLRRTGELVLKASRTGTVDVTQYSDTIVPGTLTFSAADVGRQFRVGGTGVPITIARLSGANAVLEYPYNADSATGISAQILDAFPAMPEDFGHFLKWSILDPRNNWIIHVWLQEAHLNRMDPARTGGGDLLALASRAISSFDGRIRYEAWPYQLTAKRYPMLYYARPQKLGDLEYFGGPFRDRTDVVILAALREASLWPGDGETKNALFGADKTQNYQRLVDAELETLAGKDEDIYPTAISPFGSDRWRWAPLDANWMAEHDSSAYSVYGGNGYNFLS